MMILIATLTIAGTLFLLIAGVGIVRLPDVFCRASATTKAATLGVGCLLTAVACYFGDPLVTTRVIATISFLLLTAPVAAHMIGRAAYVRGVPLWAGTVCDEWQIANSKLPTGDPDLGPPPAPKSVHEP